MTTLAIATRNAHKASEIQAILGSEFRCVTLRDLPGAPETIEDADTFAGNAQKKAFELARWMGSSSHGLVLADDSGLEVDALDGAPGVHSARFASLDAATSGNAPDAANNAKLLRLLADVPEEKRTARFRCVLALVDAKTSQVQLFDDVCEGHILAEPRGAHGFGYDPLFVPVGFFQTFAELGEDTKNRISHRSRALAKLCAAMYPK